MNVYGGTMTSSPGPMPIALRATDSAHRGVGHGDDRVAGRLERGELDLELLDVGAVDRAPDAGAQGPQQELLLLAPELRPAANGFVRTGVPPLIASAELEIARL